MTSLIESFALWLADYYLLTCALLALALMTDICLRQPAQRLAVAKSTIIALVLLAALCMLPGWSLVHLVGDRGDHRVGPMSITASNPPISSPAATREDSTSVESQTALSTPANTVAPAIEDAPPTATVLTPLTRTTLLALVHALGAACVFAWLTVGVVAARRLRCESNPAPTNLVKIMNKLSARNGTGDVQAELLVSNRIEVAVALGIRRPAVLLPEQWISGHSPDDLRIILAHELAHIRNHDLHWLAVSRALLILLWAQPFYWLLRRRMRLDQEALADAAAADLTSRQRYAEQLVVWARDIASRPAVRLSSAVGLWEGPSQLRQRIALLIDDHFVLLRECPRRWRITSLAACALAAMGLSTATLEPGRTAPNEVPEQDESSVPTSKATGTLAARFVFDGTPPEPRELRPPVMRTLDGRVVGPIGTDIFAKYRIVDESLVVGDKGGIANIFVWVRSREIPTPPANGLPPVTISLKNGRYTPHAIAFQAPREVVFRVEDEFPCNFHYPGLRSPSNLLVRSGEQASFVVRPEPLPVHLTANIHPWLSAWLLPLPHSYFAVSDNQGVIRIENLPSGRWEFAVWHEQIGFLKTDDWPQGRFIVEINTGDNDLGTIMLAPVVFKQATAEIDHSNQSTNDKQPEGQARAADRATGSSRPPALLSYGDGKADGKKSYGGSGHLIRFELPEGVTKVRGIRIHSSRYGYPQAPDENAEITFLSDDRGETLHTEAAPYHLFKRGKENWVRVMFDKEVELSPKFWVALNFNAQQTKGVYVSYDTSTKGEYSRVGLPGDEDEPKETDFGGDWMVQLMLPRTK